MLKKINEISFEEYGLKDKPVLIFLPGWGSTAAEFSSQTRRFFENNYHCIYFDLMGQGNSKMYIKGNEYICLQNAKAFAEIIKLLNLKDISIIGNCLGGDIGVLLYLEIPNLIKSFVFIDGYLFLEKKYFPFFIPILNIPFYKFLFQSAIGIKLCNYFVKFSKVPITNKYIASRQKHSALVALDYIKDGKNMISNHLYKEVSKIIVPNLYLIGEHTLPVIKKSLEYWIKNNRKAECGYVSKTSHLTLMENPKELCFKTNLFLNNIYSNNTIKRDSNTIRI